MTCPPQFPRFNDLNSVDIVGPKDGHSTEFYTDHVITKNKTSWVFLCPDNFFFFGTVWNECKNNNN